MFEDLVALAAGALVFEGVAAAFTVYLQQLVQASGIATADEDGIHRVVELMDADGFHP